MNYGHMDVVFFVNIVLFFCVIVEFCALIGMSVKTAYKYPVRICAGFMLLAAFLMYMLQLVMYTRGMRGAIYAVYVDASFCFCGLIGAGVYCFVVGKRSNRILSILSGIFSIAPPAGTVFMVILIKRMRFDTRVEALVYNGYAYTFAALESFCGSQKLNYVDGGADEEFADLDKKQIKNHLKKLRKDRKTPEGQFAYGEALAHYCPKRMDESVRYIKKAAKGGYPSAIFNLGYMYEMGVGVSRDPKRAVELFKQAADLGDNDAAIRLGIADIKSGRIKQGMEVFEQLSEKGDKYATYNLAICHERGLGEKQPNMDKAVSLYQKCVSLNIAQRRLFALAAEHVHLHLREKESVYKTVIAGDYTGEFELMIKGLIEIHEKHAADAADLFLKAVKCRGKWEGDARCILGTLYMDCGKLEYDRSNGVAYVKTAINMTPVAKEVYAIIPKQMRKGDKKRD